MMAKKRLLILKTNILLVIQLKEVIKFNKILSKGHSSRLKLISMINQQKKVKRMECQEIMLILPSTNSMRFLMSLEDLLLLKDTR